MEARGEPAIVSGAMWLPEVWLEPISWAIVGELKPHLGQEAPSHDLMPLVV